jgi:predicted nucleic acid-binding protein
MTTAAVAPEPLFVDTNILVYAAVPAFPLHVDARMRLTELAAAGVDLWISRQTLREYLSALSRPSTFTPPIPMTTLIGDVIALLSRFQVVEDGPAVTSALLTILATVPCGGKQVYDANIVATMTTRSIRRVLTHNVSDFVRFSTWVDIVPLVPTPR